jgi:alkaline phosphatase D
MSSSSTRRSWLSASTWQGLALWSLAQDTIAAQRHAVTTQPWWRIDPFALGVASGEPRSDTVVLWTRLYPGAPLPGHSATGEELAAHMLHASGGAAERPLGVAYEVFTDAACRHRVLQGTTYTSADLGWSVHAQVRGLEPDRPYWYRFRCGNAISRVGHTRTAPTPEARKDRLRLALASCQHYEQGWFAAHADIASQPVDAVVFVGDYIYESTNAKFRLRPHTGGVPHDLAAYRERHALYKQDADLQACHAAHPWWCTWDDHEVDNDYAALNDRRNSDPSVFRVRRAAAYRAYLEHMPIWPLGPGEAAHRIHRHWSWGDLADVWTLDCRQYRSPQPCADPLRGGGRVTVGCEERNLPERTMLGAEQEHWLSEGLANSRRRWRVVAQSTQLSSTGVNTPMGRSIYTDGWDGYSAARSRMMSDLASGDSRNVVVLGGDVHQNVAALLRASPNDRLSASIAVEFVCTSISSRGMSAGMLEKIRRDNPDIVFARSDERGYALVDIERDHVTTRFRTTPFPARPGALLAEQAAFRVAHGVADLMPI